MGVTDAPSRGILGLAYLREDAQGRGRHTGQARGTEAGGRLDVADHGGLAPPVAANTTQST